MIEVQNLGDKEENVELSLYGDDVLVDLTKLHLKAGERFSATMPMQSRQSTFLSCQHRVPVMTGLVAGFSG